MKNLKLWVLVAINFAVLTAMVLFIPEGNGRVAVVCGLVVADVAVYLLVQRADKKSAKIISIRPQDGVGPSIKKTGRMIWLVSILFALAGVLRALHDTMTHSPSEGKPAKWGLFWQSLYSWRLKYKNLDPNQGPRFPGSTTIFVALTDGWHLSNLAS